MERCDALLLLQITNPQIIPCVLHRWTETQFKKTHRCGISWTYWLSNPKKFCMAYLNRWKLEKRWAIVDPKIKDSDFSSNDKHSKASWKQKLLNWSWDYCLNVIIITVRFHIELPDDLKSKPDEMPRNIRTLTFLGVGRCQQARVANHPVDVPRSVFQHVITAVKGKKRQNSAN